MVTVNLSNNFNSTGVFLNSFVCARNFKFTIKVDENLRSSHMEFFPQKFFLNFFKTHIKAPDTPAHVYFGEFCNKIFGRLLLAFENSKIICICVEAKQSG